MTAPPIGHNSGYEGYWELRMAIWDSREPLVVKAMALAILEYMRPENFQANPTRKRIREMCGISENTLERHWGAISQWIEVIKQRGRVSVYRARIYACASELIEMLPGEPPQPIGGSYGKVVPIRGATSATVPTTKIPTESGYPSETRSLVGGYPTPIDGGCLEPYKDTNNNYPSVEEGVGEVRASAETDRVRVNGVGIVGPWFTLDNEMIRVAGEMNFIPEAKRTLVAELIARRWVSKNERPASLMDALSRAMARQRLHMQTDEAKLKIELEKLQTQQQQPAPATPKASSLPSHWRDREREESRKIGEDIKNFFGAAKEKRV